MFGNFKTKLYILNRLKIYQDKLKVIMRESGVVVRTYGAKALIRMTRGNQCEGCNICKNLGQNHPEVEAENQISAQPGDCVDVEINPKHIVIHSLLLFIFPLVALFIGYFIGIHIDSGFAGSPESRGIVLAIAFLIGSFGLVKLYDSLFQKSQKQSAVIVATGPSRDDKTVMFW